MSKKSFVFVCVCVCVCVCRYHSHDEQAVLIEPVMRIVRAGQARGLPMVRAQYQCQCECATGDAECEGKIADC